MTVGKINVLGFDVANLIAAGEVVDRPSSVVKELLENAIDSGANKITVEIKNGGITFIRITDNGCGIQYDDLPVAILRHATSKIKDATDLESIFTLGFRGEALAAISSVSKIRIMSKQEDSEFGAMLEAHGGNVVNHTSIGCANGTTVIVEDLFYNVPARKKFLKKDATEAMAITSIVEKVALSRPDISFRYLIDNQVKYVTAGDGSLQNVIYAILGRDVSKKTIQVEREDGGIKVEGFISTPELVRANRNLENFYINSRFVKSKTASAALEQAYTSYIPSDKFPFCVLNIVIDPSSVDVNVHPAKLEVKFSNEKLIFDAVYYAVRTALSNRITTPTLYNDDEKRSKEAKELINTLFPVKDRESKEQRPQRIVFDSNTNFGTLCQNNTLDYSSLDKKDENKKASEPIKEDDAFTIKFNKNIKTIEVNSVPTYDMPIKTEPIIACDEKSTKKAVEENKDEQKALENTKITEDVAQIRVIPDYKIIGEAFNSYVIVELGDIMYLIDKHAAHERIIFEDLKKKLSLSTPSSQILMMPIEIDLDASELMALSDWGEEIKKTGFGYDLSNKTVSIYEIPSEIELSSAQDTFLTLCERLVGGEAQGEKSRYERFERALYQASCKAAIKAGRAYDKDHIKWICDRVLTLDNIKYCPHGRPIAFEITKHFLEKQFERIK